jgi:DNA replication protein DnaC
MSVPSRYQITSRTEVFSTKALRVIHDAVAGLLPKDQLVIEGGVGSGKTFALHDGERLLVAERSCERIAFLDFPSFIARMLDRKRRRRTLDVLFEADVAIIDDAGSSHVSKMPIGLFEEVVIYRHTQNYATWIATNLAPTQFRETFGLRVYDRLRGDGAWFNVSTPSLRGRWKGSA